MTEHRVLRAGTCRGSGSNVTAADAALRDLLGLPSSNDGEHVSITERCAGLIDTEALVRAQATAAIVAPYERSLVLADGEAHPVVVVLTADPQDPGGWSAAVIVRDAEAPHEGPNEGAGEALIERLAAQERLVRIASRLARIAGWSVVLPEREVHFTPEMSTVLGIEAPPRLRLESALRFYPEPFRTVLRSAVERCLTEGVDFDVEAQVAVPGGDPVPLRVVGEARRDEAGTIVGLDGGVSDLSSLKQIEAEVRRQAGALDAASFAISIQEVDGTLVYWNAAAERMYGWTREEAIGHHISELVGETDRAIFDDLSRRLDDRGSWSGRIENMDRFGRRFPVSLQVTLIRDEQGNPTSRFSVVADISDRVELEERLAMTQRLDSLGQLTGGIAHDFNNLLTVIVGGAELLTDSLRDDPANAPIARMLLTAAERGAELTNRLLVFARRQSLQPEVVDAAEVVEEMFPLLRRSLPEHVEMEVQHGQDLWPVLVDPGQLEAALMNIAVNARDAMDAGGALCIRTANVTLSEAEAERFVGARAGDYVRVAITDTGIGMSPEVAEHAFEPFFTTKDIGRGNGLGLSMVYGFVQQSGGFVELDSELGTGTTIQLHLPRGDVSEGPLTVSEEPAQVHGGSETVLVVEDEELVREHAIRLLGELGYVVVGAGNGRDALERLREHPQVAALFTDVVMPGGMSGFELAAAARALRPGLPVLYTSGYVDADPGDDPSVAGEVLRKPYRRDVLADRLRRTIDGID